jgi:hypothetical protein
VGEGGVGLTVTKMSMTVGNVPPAAFRREFEARSREKDLQI